MEAERKMIHGIVLPKVNELCRAHRVRVHLIDLKYGLDPSQPTTGEASPAFPADGLTRSLAGVDLCIGFFMALVGQRFGIVPEGAPVSFKAAHDWLKAWTPGMSIEALECHHGLLNAAEVAPTAAFAYLRDPEFLDWVPEESRQAFVGNKYDQKNVAALRSAIVAACGGAGAPSAPASPGPASSLAPASSASGGAAPSWPAGAFRKLYDGYPCKYDEKSPAGRPSLRGLEPLGKRIAEDLLEAVRALFPLSELPQTLSRDVPLAPTEGLGFRQFSERYSGEWSGKVDLGFPEARRLAKFLALPPDDVSQPPWLFLQGEPGSGKSVLTKIVVKRHLEDNVGDVCVLDVVDRVFGADTSARAVAQRVIENLAAEYVNLVNHTTVQAELPIHRSLAARLSKGTSASYQSRTMASLRALTGMLLKGIRNLLQVTTGIAIVVDGIDLIKEVTIEVYFLVLIFVLYFTEPNKTTN